MVEISLSIHDFRIVLVYLLGLALNSVDSAFKVIQDLLGFKYGRLTNANEFVEFAGRPNEFKSVGLNLVENGVAHAQLAHLHPSAACLWYHLCDYQHIVLSKVIISSLQQVCEPLLSLVLFLGDQCSYDLDAEGLSLSQV